MVISNNLLLTPYDRSSLKLKNRVVMAPMTRNRTRNEDHIPDDQNALYYAQRASAGLIITEGIPVSSQAVGSLYIPHIYTEAQTLGWKKVVERVHEQGGVIFAQLWHVGRLSHPNILKGQLPHAPSAINPNFKTYGPKGFQETITPHEMTEEEIQITIQHFVEAALHSARAGFDGIELHAANGYLFHQFFMECANQRTDQYGGSITNRARFLLEVLDAIAKVYPIEKVGVRLSPDLNNTFGITQDATTNATFEYIVERLNEYPLAYLHLSGFSLDENHKGMEQILATARKYRALYHGTLIINKGFNATTGHLALKENIADLISFGIPYISNPDLVARMAHNEPWAEADRSTFYGGNEKGYTDYPNMDGTLPILK